MPFQGTQISQIQGGKADGWVNMVPEGEEETGLAMPTFPRGSYYYR